jgi:hypothetical protein
MQELAIINRTIRQATIVAKETIELMSIDIEVEISLQYLDASNFRS